MQTKFINDSKYSWKYYRDNDVIIYYVGIIFYQNVFYQNMGAISFLRKSLFSIKNGSDFDNFISNITGHFSFSGIGFLARSAEPPPAN